MRYSVWKKAIAVSLVASMAAGLTACGGGGSASVNKDQRYFKAEYLSDLPDSFNEQVSTIKFNGDMMYYTVYNEDYTKCTMYSYNLVSGDSMELYGVKQNDGKGGSCYISDFTISEDGNVYLYIGKSEVDESSVTEDYSNATLDDVLAYMTDTWGYEEEMAQKDWDEYYASQYTNEDGSVDYSAFLIAQNAQYIQTAQIMKIDESGNQVFCNEMPKDDQSDSMGVNGMAADKNGNIYLAANYWSQDGTKDEYFIMIFDQEGNQKGKIKTDNYTNSMVTLKDGKVYATGWGDNGCEMTPVDADAMKMVTDQKISIPSDSVTPLDEKNILLTENTSIYKYNIDSKQKELYFSWMDCNISSSSVNAYSVLSDGRIAAYIQNWRSGNSNAEIALIKEVDASEVAETINLTMATLWSDSDIEQTVIDFNKSQDKYHVTIKAFGDGDVEYEDALNNFRTAITSDTGYDLVVFNSYAEAMNFAAKGLNADLYSLIDNDADLSRDDFMSNVMTACEYDGKLVCLPTVFFIQTLIGKAEDVGTTPGWTIDQVKALMESKPEGTTLLKGMTKSDALSMLMSLGYRDFINLEETTCSFDSQEFIDVLKFAAMFPDSYEWSEDEEDISVLLSQGKQLLDTFYLSDFEQMQVYRAMFGGDTTFIGYPNSAGENGALLSFNNIIGISNNCKDIDGAWQLLRTFYLPKKSDDNSYSWGFSVRKDEFEKFCQKAMKEKEDTSIYGYGSMEIEVKAATQEDVDQVKNLVENTTAVYGAASEEVTNIINEEAAAYFSGQKSAEEVAKIIQSRMQVYLSETK